MMLATMPPYRKNLFICFSPQNGVTRYLFHSLRGAAVSAVATGSDR
jgi:hypothetical protein